jgi:hypothetical protein
MFGGIKMKGDKCNMAAFIPLNSEIGATLLTAHKFAHFFGILILFLRVPPGHWSAVAK